MKITVTTLAAVTCGLFAQTSAFAFTQLSATQDSDVYFGSGFPTGSVNTLGVSDNAAFGGGHGQSSLVEFDVSGVAESITAATLWLYVEPIPGGGFASFTPGNVNVFTQASDWNVITLTSASFDEGNDLGDIAVTQQGVWVAHDVTTTVQDWVSGSLANHGFLLTVTDMEGTGTQFASMETAFGPVLAINGTPSLVPEPSSYATIFGLASLAFAVIRRRHKA